MSKALVVLGNGFDLCHDLKTKYMDFIIFIKEQKANPDDLSSEWNLNNPFLNFFIDYPGVIDNWVDFESVLRIFIMKMETLIDCFYTPLDININPPELDSNDKLIQRILVCFPLLLHDDRVRSKGHIIYEGEQNIRFKPEFCHDLYGINKIKIIEYIRECFDEFMRIFTFYFILISNETIKPIPLFQRIEAEKVITFNYTSTYKHYPNFSSTVIHVHGKFDENNLILGFHDENPEKLDFVYFKKYYQSIIKTGIIFEMNDCCVKNGNYPSEVHFIGHSLDMSDEDKIKEIFKLLDVSKQYNTNQVVKFYFYYYNNKDLESKYVNLMKLVTKKTFLEYKKNGIFKFNLIE